MKYPRIVSAIQSAKWAIVPSSIDAIVTTLGAAMRGEIKQHRRASMLDMIGEEEPMRQKMRNVGQYAVIPVTGIIGKRLSSMETSCGGCDLDAVGGMVDKALMDPRVGALVFDFDSPGGTITGVPELAARIKAAGAKKMTIAWTETQCCSAAYWMASQCNRFICSPSADVGSIGVYMALVDTSANWAKEGYRLELIKAGAFKGAGMRGAPITDGQRSIWQEEVDAIYADFVATIRNVRPGVADEACQGQTFMGAPALAASLVDEVDPDFMRNLLSAG